jgi:hypothetical protein
MNALLTVLVPLVDKTPAPADVKPGWLGFGVFVALAVAVALLWFSMRKQLRKVDFEEQPDRPRQPKANGGKANGGAGRD